MHSQSTGSIIVYMDDDDYYPPERISHAVERLQKNKQALCAGSSELYIYFKQIKKMYQCGPYGPQHATAGTFAFKKELLSITKYNEKACLAEEKEFLHNYTIPFVQLDPLKTILVFSHIHNTYDKKKMLENPNPQFTKESDKTVDMFIKYDSEANIKRFFLKEIDNKLDQYKPGDPKMKPDVLKQIKELEQERIKMFEEKKKEMMKKADLVFLCLPDAASREAVALGEELEEDCPIFIDASTAHRTSTISSYGLPELSDEYRNNIYKSNLLLLLSLKRNFNLSYTLLITVTL
mgnify:CR=1 FL=1